jgi:hypothetical protein
MERRTFLVRGGQTLVCALAPHAAKSLIPAVQIRSVDSSNIIEQRVATVIQTYDAQGNHRTGTDVDKKSGEWLAEEVRRLGVNASLESFTLNRVDPQSCYLRVGNRRIDGVPLFDAGFTDADGVHGKLGMGPAAEIRLLETGPFPLARPGAEHRGPISEARGGVHKAVVLVAGGSRPGLFLTNALAFRNPSGPPMLQVSNTEIEWLRRQSQRGAEATVVTQVTRAPAQAFNVTTRIAGSNSKLPPLVFMAARSAWWQCVTEQGNRLACWLEVMRVLAASKPARDCLFVALSGHELGMLGMDAYIENRQDLLRDAHAWIFFGSGIGSPRQPNLIHTSDKALEKWVVTALEQEGIGVDAREQHSATARAEMEAVQRKSGRFVTLVCDSEVYHSAADRWPEAVDVGLLARYARAFANGALQLAHSET